MAARHRYGQTHRGSRPIYGKVAMRGATVIAKRRAARDDGFTLIELMVVVLIIAILIAIAIPTFLGARTRAQDRAAQSSLRNSLSAAKTAFTDSSTFPATAAAAVTSFGAIETSVTFQDTPASSGPKEIQVVSSTATDVILSVMSKSNKCYFVTDSSAFGTGFSIETGTCAAATAPSALTVTPTPGTNATASASGTAPTWASAW